ncbi:unnamed protein product [Rhizophagus irregularis]|nr:unnamed protein product [Rhizophagus irregularis]
MKPCVVNIFRAILHASLYIVKRITDKELTLAPQLEIVGEESTGWVDYAIKALEELLCITEGKLHQVVMGFAQNLVQCESALQVNKKNRKRKSGEAFREDFDYIYGISYNSLGMVFYSFCLRWDIEHEQGSPQYPIYRISLEGQIGGRKRLM